MRIVHLVLAPRLLGAEVLAKDLAIHQQKGGETVAMASLVPAHDDFTALRAEFVDNGVKCPFPDRLHGCFGKFWNLYQTLRAYRADVIFAHATIPAFYSTPRDAARRARRVRHAFGHQRFRKPDVPPCRASADAAHACGDRGIAEQYRRLRRGSRPPSIDIADTERRRHVALRHARAAHADGAQIVQIGRYTSVKNQLGTVHAFRQVVE